MHETPKTIVFGKNGFLGSYLFLHYKNNPNTYFGSRSKDNKLLIHHGNQVTREFPWSYNSLTEVIHEFYPEVIVNAIALVDAKRCEASPKLAEQANSEIPAVLAKAARGVDARVLQISTDAVFGQSGSFFSEFDDPHPKSIYGKTKFQGERAVIESAPKHLIIRTNFYGYHRLKPTLFNYFYQNLLLESGAQGYVDVLFNPIYVKDLILGIQKFIETEVQGILHFAGDEALSKFDFGNSISLLMGEHAGKLSRLSFSEMKGEEYRKLDLTLSSGVRKSHYRCAFDVKSGIRDAILNAKAEENEV